MIKIRPTSLSDIISLRSLKEPFLFLISIGLVFLLPQSNLVFAGVAAVVIILTFNKPVRVLYISTALLSMRYFFANNGTMRHTNLGMFSPWRFRLYDDPFVKNSDKLVFILLLVAIITILANRGIITRRMFAEYHRLRNLVAVFLIITVLSAIANQVGVTLTFFFLQLFLRPVLFLVLILLIKWDERRVFNYFIFVFSIMFLMQIIPSFIENIPNLMHGTIFFADQFVGTFVYQINYVTVQILFYAFCILLINVMNSPTKKNLFFLLLCVFSIVSAQSGFQTFIVLVSLLPFFYMILFRPHRFGLRAMRSRGAFFFSSLGVTVLVGYIVLNPSIGGNYLVTGYSELATQRVLQEGVFKIPKFATYGLLFDYWKDGDINPVIGDGPTKYLSGGAFLEGNKYTRVIIGNRHLFSAGMFSNMLSYPFNNFVGVAGEIGVFGYLALLFIYILPAKYVWRNLRKYRNSFWSPVAGGFIGMFFCLIGWSFFWNTFEDTVMSVMYCIVGGILIVVNESALIHENETTSH